MKFLETIEPEHMVFTKISESAYMNYTNHVGIVVLYHIVDPKIVLKRRRYLLEDYSCPLITYYR